LYTVTEVYQIEYLAAKHWSYCMPENPNAYHTFATFRIWGPHLDVDAATQRLGIAPSEFHRIGAARGRTGVWRHSYWGLCSEAHLRSTDLSLHLAWLLDRIAPVQPQIAQLIAAGNQADLFCFWESLTGYGGPVFPPPLLRRLADLQLPLGLDLYCAT
jgi:hypothetical protein